MKYIMVKRYKIGQTLMLLMVLFCLSIFLIQAVEISKIGDIESAAQNWQRPTYENIKTELGLKKLKKKQERIEAVDAEKKDLFNERLRLEDLKKEQLSPKDLAAVELRIKQLDADVAARQYVQRKLGEKVPSLDKTIEEGIKRNIGDALNQIEVAKVNYRQQLQQLLAQEPIQFEATQRQNMRNQVTAWKEFTYQDIQEAAPKNKQEQPSFFENELRKVDERLTELNQILMQVDRLGLSEEERTLVETRIAQLNLNREALQYAKDVGITNVTQEKLNTRLAPLKDTLSNKQVQLKQIQTIPEIQFDAEYKEQLNQRKEAFTLPDYAVVQASAGKTPAERQTYFEQQYREIQSERIELQRIREKIEKGEISASPDEVKALTFRLKQLELNEGVLKTFETELKKPKPAQAGTLKAVTEARKSLEAERAQQTEETRKREAQELAQKIKATDQLTYLLDRIPSVANEQLMQQRKVVQITDWILKNQNDPAALQAALDKNEQLPEGPKLDPRIQSFTKNRIKYIETLKQFDEIERVRLSREATTLEERQTALKMTQELAQKYLDPQEDIPEPVRLYALKWLYREKFMDLNALEDPVKAYLSQAEQKLKAYRENTSADLVAYLMKGPEITASSAARSIGYAADAIASGINKIAAERFKSLADLFGSGRRAVEFAEIRLRIAEDIAARTSDLIRDLAYDKKGGEKGLITLVSESPELALKKLEEAQKKIGKLESLSKVTPIKTESIVSIKEIIESFKNQIEEAQKQGNIKLLQDRISNVVFRLQEKITVMNREYIDYLAERVKKIRQRFEGFEVGFKQRAQGLDSLQRQTEIQNLRELEKKLQRIQDPKFTAKDGVFAPVYRAMIDANQSIVNWFRNTLDSSAKDLKRASDLYNSARVELLDAIGLQPTIGADPILRDLGALTYNAAEPEIQEKLTQMKDNYQTKLALQRYEETTRELIDVYRSLQNSMQGALMGADIYLRTLPVGIAAVEDMVSPQDMIDNFEWRQAQQEGLEQSIQALDSTLKAVTQNLATDVANALKGVSRPFIQGFAEIVRTDFTERRQQQIELINDLSKMIDNQRQQLEAVQRKKG